MSPPRSFHGHTNSGLYLRRFSCTFRPPFRTRPYWVPYPESRRLASPDFRAGRLAVVITADEDANHSDNNVLTVVAVPGLTATAVPAALTHYSLTGLYDDVLGAPKLRNAATAPSFAANFGLTVGP